MIVEIRTDDYGLYGYSGIHLLCSECIIEKDEDDNIVIIIKD